VLDDVSFRVPSGRLTGFVGGNGAGKTTTMRIVLGVLGRDSEVTLDGAPVTAADRRLFGYMPEERGLYPKMRVLEHIVTSPVCTGSTRSRPPRGGASSSSVSASAFATTSRPLAGQSAAQIAAALVHDPQVLILDEPFSGLDPLAVDVVAGVLQAGGPGAVLFSSHQLDVVERLCDDLVIIADGTIRAAGTRDALRAEHAQHR
jgi:ABC-2 type transport system ATP-binding protein